MPDSGDKQFARKKPCAECPFSRAVTPGTVGGSDPTVYVGQLIGPFLLCCHMDPKYDGKKKGMQPEVAQCAGAAIMRANVGVAPTMPEALHALPADKELVFSSFEELLAHHRRCTIFEAADELRETPPDILLQIEFYKVRPDMVIPVKRK